MGKAYSPSVLLAAMSIGAMLVISIFGPAHVFGMEMTETGEMGGCIFSGNAALCRMSITEHIARWQDILVVTLEKSSKALLSLIGVAFAAVFFARRAASFLFKAQEAEAVTARRLSRLFCIAPFLNPLERMFARGILHPKIYEPPLF